MLMHGYVNADHAAHTTFFSIVSPLACFAVHCLRRVQAASDECVCCCSRSCAVDQQQFHICSVIRHTKTEEFKLLSVRRAGTSAHNGLVLVSKLGSSSSLTVTLNQLFNLR